MIAPRRVPDLDCVPASPTVSPMRLSPLLLVVLLTACAGQATRPSAMPESEVRASHDLADIAPALAESGTRRTLLVLDIDDTLLTSDGFFGSDKWYEWQKTLPAGDPGKVRTFSRMTLTPWASRPMGSGRSISAARSISSVSSFPPMFSSAAESAADRCSRPPSCTAALACNSASGVAGTGMVSGCAGVDGGSPEMAFFCVIRPMGSGPSSWLNYVTDVTAEEADSILP